jgi:hypothetical protein
MHPIGGREVGWDQVRGSWEQVAQLATQGQVKLSDQFIQVQILIGEAATRALIVLSAIFGSFAQEGISPPSQSLQGSLFRFGIEADREDILCGERYSS